MPLMPALMKQRQEDIYESEVRWTVDIQILSQKNQETKQNQEQD